MEVRFGDIGNFIRGFFDGNSIAINFNEYSIKYNLGGIKSTLYHEIQHAVQDFENFARGGTEKSALKALKRTENQHLADDVKDMAQKSNTTRGDIAYRNLHGEVEARNTQQRMRIQNFAKHFKEKDPLASSYWKEKTKLHPHKTQDVDIKDTIIDFGN